ncbi:MAG: GyrI-like domain-containing protein [Bacteroidia bacterium]|nr:GyrI-like domain-containing protein [Bacteroidia bacterium]
MNLVPEIKILQEKKLAGLCLPMSLVNNRTVELWRSFMPRRKEFLNTVSSDFYSLQIYDSSYSFSNFNPHANFHKWASVEVSDFDTLPEGMQALTVPEGLYAVFHYKGDTSNAAAIFQYIFGTWLPQSEFELSNRPHFEVLGEKYKNNHPDSEEDIWIPIQRKN